MNVSLVTHELAFREKGAGNITKIMVTKLLKHDASDDESIYDKP
jgi:hypothetical protein